MNEVLIWNILHTENTVLEVHNHNVQYKYERLRKAT